MSLLDQVRRVLVEDARKALSDPRPLYVVAGAADAAAGFLRTVPTRVEHAADTVREEWTPERFGDAFADLGAQVRGRRDRVAEDLADLTADARDLPAQVRDRARQAPGRAVVAVAGQVGAAYEAVDSLADRGRLVVARLRGDAVPGEAPTAPSAVPDGAAAPVTRPIRPSTPPRPDDEAVDEAVVEAVDEAVVEAVLEHGVEGVVVDVAAVAEEVAAVDAAFDAGPVPPPDSAQGQPAVDPTPVDAAQAVADSVRHGRAPRVISPEEAEGRAAARPRSRTSAARGTAAEPAPARKPRKKAAARKPKGDTSGG